MRLLEYIESKASDGRIVDADGRGVEVLVDPSEVRRAVTGKESVMIVRTRAEAASSVFEIADGGHLRLTEVFLAESSSKCVIRQSGGARCDATCVVVAAASAAYEIDLDGRDAENTLRGAFIVGGEERAEIDVRVNHNSSDCRSDSLIKGVAGGRSTGEFVGLVYVAPDAQRTDARQTSRNIELGGEARIVAKPQLEIYADDVKCSHGATVGQLDADAVMYMRQRGLSEAQARRLQIEGFVCDIVSAEDEIGVALAEVLTDKLERL